MKRTRFIYLLSLLLLAGFFVTGCRGAAPLRRVHVGMTQKQVKRKIGRPLHVFDARKGPEGEIVEVWEYKAEKIGPQRFWLTFIDGKLVEWRRVDEFHMGRPPIPRNK